MTPEEIRAVAERWFAASSARDLDALFGMYADDVRVWHAWDRSVKSLDDARRVNRWMARNVADLRFENVRRSITQDGWVQRHTMCGVVTRSGEAFAVEACIVVSLGGDGMVREMEEFLDTSQLGPLLG